MERQNILNELNKLVADNLFSPKMATEIMDAIDENIKLKAKTTVEKKSVCSREMCNREIYEDSGRCLYHVHKDME